MSNLQVADELCLLPTEELLTLIYELEQQVETLVDGKCVRLLCFMI